MAKINPYILARNGKKAIELYENLFGATIIDRMPYTPEMGKEMGLKDDFDYENSTMHAVIDLNGAEIMIADNIFNLHGSGNVEIVVHLDSKEELEKIFSKAKEMGFKIKMDLQETFWGAIYARFEDSEGVGWQLNHQKENNN